MQKRKRVLSDVSDFEALSCMSRRGGSFASALAAAWLRSDSENFRALRLAFPQLLEDYRRFALLERPATPRYGARLPEPGDLGE